MNADDKISSRTFYSAVGGIIVVMVILTTLISPLLVFGDAFIVAVSTFSTVTIAYLASSIVSKLSLHRMLEQHNIDPKQLNLSFRKTVFIRMVILSAVVGGLASLASCLTPENIEYSELAFVTIIVIIVVAPVINVLLSWLNSG